jgi:hypothetical protein
MPGTSRDRSPCTRASTRPSATLTLPYGVACLSAASLAAWLMVDVTAVAPSQPKTAAVAPSLGANASATQPVGVNDDWAEAVPPW